MKKVAFFTTFYEAKSGYSLITVAETQIRMLLNHGYDPVVLVQNQYQESESGEVGYAPFEQVPPPSVWNDKVADLRSVVPAMKLNRGIDDQFEQRTSLIYHELLRNLKDVDVCITHDIILQDWYKEHNVAMRRVAKDRPDILWLHWIHSVPSENGSTGKYPRNCRYSPPPGYIVYPNDVDRPRVIRTYKLAGQEHRVIACRAGHSLDPLLAWPYTRLTRDLIRKTDFLGGEVTAVYPARLDRGKQPEKAIRLMAGVQKAGYETRLLICDWQSQGKQFKEYAGELTQLVEACGLGGKVFFTSRLHDECTQGVPRQVVLELMDLSNVYIHPSKVETYSLTVHEAALRGCLLVLNHDWQAMRELFGDSAIYMDFGAEGHPRNYRPSEQAFWDDEAMRLIAELRQNRAVMAKTKARTRWTPAATWRDFERLLYLKPVDE
jgi:glycosyltransferase involved in cell wall biosynthesis